MSPLMRNGLRDIENEVEILRKLDHQNIIKLVEVLRDGVKQFIVLEYCDAGTLQTFVDIDQGEDQIRLYFKQMIEGLEYLHSQGIVHRDIKPENIGIQTNHTLKLLDFSTSIQSTISEK